MEEDKKVMVVSTGGTILRWGEGSTYGPIVPLEAFLATLPATVFEAGKVEGRALMYGKSQDFSWEKWWQLAQEVQQLLDDTSVLGVVIMHGTHAMEEMAYFFSLIFPNDKPIIFTGSLSPFGSPSQEGLAHVQQAVECVRTGTEKGVFLNFFGRLWHPRFFSKSALIAHSLHPGLSLSVTPKKNIRDFLGFHTLNLKVLKKNVFIIRDCIDTEPHHFLKKDFYHSVSGIILEGFGEGYPSKKMEPFLKQCIDQNCYVVRCSREVGTTVSWDERYDGQYGFLPSGSLGTTKSHILLSLAICSKMDKSSIQSLFYQEAGVALHEHL